MKRLFSLFLVLGISLLLVSFVSAQTTPYSVNIVITDGNTNNTDTLTIGEQTGATYGVDKSLGEYELPPAPLAGVFDARSIDLPAELAAGDTAHGQGMKIDYRTLGLGWNTDTFYVQMQPSTENTSDSLTVSWPATLASTAGGYWVLETTVGGVVNGTYTMTGTATSVTIPVTSANSAARTYFYIISADGTTFETFTYNRICTDMTGTGVTKFGGEPKPAGVKKATTNPTVPNINDLGDQLFTLHEPSNTMVVGSVTARSVLLKKWSAVLKSAIEKGYTHQLDSATCLWFVHKDKVLKIKRDTGATKKTSVKYDSLGIKRTFITKQLTELDPTYGKGYNNGLFAELMTFQFNIDCSNFGSTPGGLSNILCTNENLTSALLPFGGMTLGHIDTLAQEVLSCSDLAADTTWPSPDTGSTAATATPYEYAAALHLLNSSFAQADNASLTDIAGGSTAWNDIANWPKGPGKLTLTGVVKIKDVPYLLRTLAVTPHAAPKNLHSVAAEPDRYTLEQNYPNPFNPTTNIDFTLSTNALVTVKVYNILGQEVLTLANRQEFSAGTGQLQFNGNALASGVYFYRMIVNDAKTGAVKFMETHKMMLVK
jgi:hypothetical protein